jgi:hypothetical protein
MKQHATERDVYGRASSNKQETASCKNPLGLKMTDGIRSLLCMHALHPEHHRNGKI